MQSKIMTKGMIITLAMLVMLMTIPFAGERVLRGDQGEARMMQTVISQDGTTIAYDQMGEGPMLVLVGGAFSYRKYPGWVQLAKLLAPYYSVVTYDRRGRGDSGDLQPYAVEREIEDLQAVIDAVGGEASVFGMSSGAVLALRAAAHGVPIERLALYQPPFIVDADASLPPKDFAPQLDALLAADQRGEAVKYFMTKGMGAPGFFVTFMRFTPTWSKLTAVAHTLPYDYAIMGDTVQGSPLAAEPWAAVTVPTLVIDGEKSPAGVHHAAQALVGVLPNGQRHTLAGQSHDVSMQVLAPVLAEFFATPLPEVLAD